MMGPLALWSLRVKTSANPIHRMQNKTGFYILHSKSMSMSMPGRRVAGPVLGAGGEPKINIFSKIPTRTEMRGIMWLGSSLSLGGSVAIKPRKSF